MKYIKIAVILIGLSTSPFSLAENQNETDAFCAELKVPIQEIINKQQQGISKQAQLKAPLAYEAETGRNMATIKYIIDVVYDRLKKTKKNSDTQARIIAIHADLQQLCRRSMNGEFE